VVSQAVAEPSVNSPSSGTVLVADAVEANVVGIDLSSEMFARGR